MDDSSDFTTEFAPQFTGTGSIIGLIISSNVEGSSIAEATASCEADSAEFGSDSKDATSIAGIASSPEFSSAGAPEGFIVITQDQKVYSKVEDNAKKIYDKYNHDHIKEKNEGATLIATGQDLIKQISEITYKTSKKELLMSLDALQNILKETNPEDGIKLTRKKNEK